MTATSQYVAKVTLQVKQVIEGAQWRLRSDLISSAIPKCMATGKKGIEFAEAKMNEIATNSLWL